MKLLHFSVGYNYKGESWGFAMTNKVEGFGGVTDTTERTYYTSGNGKGQVKTEKRQSGLLIQYVYDNVDRVISETRSGPDMMTEKTTYDYTPVDPSDPVLPVDTRPRTVVKKLNGVECERTYYVYSPLTNIVERVGTQGAAYGGTNVLRTVTTFYPVTVGAADPAARSGFVASIRHEDGKLDVYDYSLVSNLWVRTITHLHEQSPSPVSGKTTRDITLANARGEEIESRTEAFIDGIWYTIARNRMTYNLQGKRITSENLAGQITTTAWDCCHKVSEVQPDGSTTTWDYDDEGRVIASSRLIPLDMTNVTWLTTCYRYDALGRQTATWQTNFAAHVGLPVTRTRYDQLGRVIARVDQLGNTTATTYSPDGRTVSVHNPNTSTALTARSASGESLSITGTAVTPEFHSYGILPDGIRWSKTVQGETASSPRFTKRYENLLGQTICEERSGFQGAVLATTRSFDSLGRLVSTSADYEPTTEFTYDDLGNRIATTRTVGRAILGAPQSDATEWRKTETLSSFVLDDAVVWRTQTNVVSCSDSVIAPLVTSSSHQLTGLTSALPARSRSADVRGNVTENETLVDSAIVTSRQTVPYATNKPLAISRYGVSLKEVSVSAVTNTVAYDSLGRQISTTDGRGNTRHTEYNALGQRVASIDALGNRTTYAYNQFGTLASVTDPLGHATVYEYDLRGRKTYEGGATYPIRYTYDVFGNKTTMMTYRNESLGPDSGDVTTWLYDEASGSMTNKVYADGKGPIYSYTPDGKLSRRIWVVQYNGENRPVLWENISINSPAPNSFAPTHITMSFDRMGRRVTKNKQAFIYDGYLQIANSKGNVYIWDPSERVATRPLVWEGNGVAAHYMHDGNKNVTEVISVSGDVLASYEYAAFGTTITQSGVSAAENTWRFSSECAEDDTVTVYYNYRHYDPARGRWMQRDLINEEGGVSLYGNNNDFIGCNDVLGLETIDREKYFLDLIKAPSGDYIIKVVKITEENKWKRQIGLNALRKTFASIDCTYFKNANTSQGTMRIPQEMVNHFSEFAKPGDEVVVPYSEGIRTATFLLDVIWAIKKEPTKYNELIQAMTNYTEDKSEASCYSLCGALVDYFGSLSGPLEGVVKYATGLSCVDACVNAGCKDCGEE